MRKTFSGPVEGISVAELLVCRGPEGEAEVALERVDAAVEGRTGTFVLQHGAVRGGDAEPRSFGYIVPGSGTAELEGIGEILARGNGADRQLRVFNANRDIAEVVEEIAKATEAAPAAD